jgi:hypothetical protein
MARQPIGDITEVTPTSADKVLGIDTSDSNKARNFLVPELLAVGASNWAEISSPHTAADAATFSASASDVTFAANHAGSAAVAGDADAGTVITADQANDKLVIPPKTRVKVEACVAFSLLAGDVYVLQAALDGTPLADVALQEYNAGATGNVMVASGIVDNAGATAADLTLTLKASVGGLATVTRRYLRASWVADLP